MAYLRVREYLKSCGGANAKGGDASRYIPDMICSEGDGWRPSSLGVFNHKAGVRQDQDTYLHLLLRCLVFRFSMALDHLLFRELSTHLTYTDLECFSFLSNW